MESSYVLEVASIDTKQTENDLSFIGGQPCIPESMEIPVCQLCGAEQTFFFQIAFPQDHFWHGFSMAVFACTACAHEEYFIPEMLQEVLPGINIPKGFLETYQKNFKINIFETKEGIIRKDYKEKVEFQRWNLKPTSDSNLAHNKLGGQPNWLLDDEAPGTYMDSIPMFFLMQFMEGMKFKIVEEAPPQIILNLRGNPEPSKHRYYKLFLANYLYFFGTKDRSNPLVYVLTQI
ncbi:hypothetical protein ACFFF5_16125 [Lederbergia wuyishanensis]|uniref:Uncharacterized protein n=1 Tax=Lederbergia wuyishanensis TaxID=1347903 RepID=A0ABU0D5V1_9BACI|nr:hypothetical protein [Lederbergia wuyishanensis]MCJ8008368.1 hypothetical protein [Lederbergia wuyishanensis]MDQ0343782.1 hypothetical protein [Lederbergia wuyishanensis]